MGTAWASTDGGTLAMDMLDSTMVEARERHLEERTHDEPCPGARPQQVFFARPPASGSRPKGVLRKQHLSNQLDHPAAPRDQTKHKARQHGLAL